MRRPAGTETRALAITVRRFGIVVAMAALAWSVPATPSFADSAGPTNYWSEVTEVEPPHDGVDIRVVGGDSFLVVTAQPGTVVEGRGYDGEPYFRIAADGEVEVNRNSPSYWVNQDRFAQSAVPPSASAGAEPDWRVESRSGRFGWHDHRIHWMAPQPPPAVNQAKRSLVLGWSVPLVVDGVETEVVGDLWWVPSGSPAPWVLVALAVIAALVWTNRAAAGLLVASAGALAVGISQALTSPLGLMTEALQWIPPALGLMAALAAVINPALRLRAMALGGALVGVWCVLRLSTLWRPVLPSGLADNLERALFSLALGAAAAALVSVFRLVGQSSSPD